MSFRELIVEVGADMENHGLGLFSPANPSNRTIYYGEMPADLEEGLLLIDVPSPPPEKYIDTEYLVIDIWAKSPHTERAQTLLRNVFNLYNRRNNYDLGSWHVYNSHALGGLIDADRDRQGGKLYRLSVQFISRNLSNIS